MMGNIILHDWPLADRLCTGHVPLSIKAFSIMYNLYTLFGLKGVNLLHVKVSHLACAQKKKFTYFLFY